MKKILLTMAFVLTALGNAWADNVTVDNITIPKGSSATLKIYLENSSQYRQQFQFDLELPNGITVLTGTEKLNLDRFKNKTADPASLRCEKQSSSDPNKSIVRFLAKEDDDDLIEGSEGIIMTVQLLADATLDKGVALTGNITGIEVTTHDSQAFRPSNKSFNITIGEPLDQVILDENSTSAPSASSGEVDVTVIRTIKKDQWSTLCLPFDMTSAQVKEAFGEDVELAAFTGWSFTGTASKVESINLSFTSTTSITKNLPYMILVTKPISSFDVKNVVVKPSEFPYAQQTYSVISGGFPPSTTSYTGYFLGAYNKQTIADKYLFMYNNQFWYSKGITSIKGYRAMFVLYDNNFNMMVLDAYNDSGASARVTMSFDEPTNINDVRASEDDDNIYNLSGQKVERLNKKGLFIKGGKKVVIK